MADENPAQATETVTAETPESVTAPAAVSDSQAGDSVQAPAAVDAVAAPSQPKFLGRFHTAEQLEAYAQGLEKAQAPRPATTPQTGTTQTAPTLDQIKFSKNHWRNEAFKAQAAGDSEGYQKAATNLDWCEEQLYDARLSQETKKWQGQSAISQLLNEGAELIKPYQADLVSGSPLNEASMATFNLLKTAFEAESGRPLSATQEQLISGLAVIAAAQKTGKNTAGAAQKATANFADALNRAAKTAIVTGGGAAAKTSSGKPDIAKMSDAEFEAYETSVKSQSESVSWNRYQRT